MNPSAPTPNPAEELSPLKRAFLALEDAQAKLARHEQARREPIAIVGLGVRLPGGVHDEGSFWRLLADGVDAVTEIPADRWDARACYDPDPNAPGKMSTRWGAFLERVDLFDPQFFGIAPREATGMDPQQRLMLEVAWEALENAALSPERLAGSRTGVFFGVCKNDYLQMQVKLNDPARYDGYFTSGNAGSILSGRLSYILGLQGPSITVDTACSSSLVAVHLACQSLRAGECTTALAGGVSLILAPDHTIAFCKSGMMSPEGRCKTFDAAADGFVQGEGCGVIVLQRLSEALAAGRRPLALIRASAAGQDGASSGLTAPSGPAQEAVIRDALAQAGLRPDEIGYVETHGTGTSLGDPIEVRALAATLGAERPPERPLWIGSLKTNLGHLEAGAGVSGLLKAVLCLRQRAIPPHLHFHTPSPHIPWEACPALRVPTELTPWTQEGPRRAGVSSFGFSGTNVHVILEEFDTGHEQDKAIRAEARTPNEECAGRPLDLLTVSAPTETGRAELARRYEQHLAEHENERLQDVCHTARCGRRHFPHRLAIVSENAAQLREALAAFARGEAAPGLASGEADPACRPKIAFLFTGQGSQYVNMGRALFEREPAFRAVLQRCDGLLRSSHGLALLDTLYPPPGAEAEAEARLGQTGMTQPALFALEVALAELWRAWGIEPAAVLGHSVGEYAAACVAGVFSLEDGLRLIAERGRLMQALPAGGRMAAVQTDEPTALAAIAPYADRVSLAAMNGPRSVVISGAGEAVDAILGELEARGIKGRALNVSHAFHSPLMEPMEAAFGRVAETVRYAPARIRLFSNVTGRAAGAGELAGADYWRRHVRQPVRFAEGMAALAAQQFQVFVEIGPSPVLCGMGAECLAGGQAHWLASLRRGQDGWRTLLGSLARLYTLGAEIDWEAFDRAEGARFVVLPAYPFERERYWFKPAGKDAARSAERGAEESGMSALVAAQSSGHPLLGARLALALDQTVFIGQASAAELPFLDAHRVQGKTVMPGTAYVELALAAAREALGAHPLAIAELQLKEAMIFPEAGARAVQFILEPDRGGGGSFRILSRPADEAGAPWTLHAQGVLECGMQGTGVRSQEPECGLDAIRERCTEVMDAEAFYRALAGRGVPFGPALRGVRRVWRASGEALGEIQATDSVQAEAARYHFHPARLDACLQVLAATLPDLGHDGAEGHLFLPIELRGVAFYDALNELSGTDLLLSHVQRKTVDPDCGESISVTVRLFTEKGGLLATIDEIVLKRIHTLAPTPAQQPEAEWLYQVAWHAQAQAAARETGSNASSTPSIHPRAIARTLAGRVAELGAEFGIELYERLNPLLDALCAAYVVKALTTLGWAPRPGECVTPETLGERLGVTASHHQLLALFFEWLAAEGCLAHAGEAWTVVCQPNTPAPEALLAQLEREGLAGGPEATLTRRCGERLAEALRGTIDPLEILFPGGDLACAAELYRETPLAHTLNGLMARALRTIVAAAPANGSLRILEIGAGTGGTTAHLLPELRPELPLGRTEYVFTDVGPFFLAQATQAFARYPLVKYQILDIEQSPEEQGLAREGFDVVIAANVLHATTDLRRTLDHVRSLLVPGGSLMLLESTRPQRWTDLTFGLTAGWWKFTDTALRPAHPLVNAPCWLKLLADSGFEEGAAVSEVDSGDTVSANAVILARAPRAQVGHAPRRSSGMWLAFADQGGLGERIAQLLADQGSPVAIVTPGAAWRQESAWRYQIDPEREEDYGRLLAELQAAGGAPLRGVIYGWALDEPDLDELTSERVTQALACRGALALVQALTRLGAATSPRLWLLTRGAEAVVEGDARSAVTQALLRGLARTVRLEHPELQCVRIDLDPAAHGAEEARQLLHELTAPDGEDKIAYRHGVRHVARLGEMRNVEGGRRHPDQPAGAARIIESPEHPVELVNTTRGLLDGLQYRPMAPPVPGPGQVLIRVQATGLNFRDVLNALGLYGDTPVPLGGECAGTVLALGEGVSGLEVGTPVVTITPNSFATCVIASAAITLPRPASLSAAQAAGLLIPYLTAAYALQTCGRMARGSRVLIHAAAGGVGLAAVELARQAGAEIFATAGNPEKRDFLRSLGIEHVMDSRSLDFARETLERSGGRGVDLVLNSLAGEFIRKGIEVLAPGGRFLEIGRRGVWTSEQVAELRPDVEYHLIDLTGDLRDRPGTLRPQLQALLDQVAAGALPPLPTKVFPIEQTGEAFRFMNRARHIGRLVVTRPAQPAPATTWREGTCLITGGLGGLGLLTARWLAGRGVRHLALVGRHEPAEEARAILDELERAGAAVTVYLADVAREDELAGVIRAIQAGPAPLRGVIHAAGVLDDGVLAQQSWPRFAAVLAPKVNGAWNLHRLTADLPLDFFILYSSIAAVFGSPGQGNHAAANAFMDALAHARRARGLPGLSVNWGAWAEAGAAVRGGTAKRLALKGMKMMAPEDGFALLDRLLAGGTTQAVVLPVHWPRFLEQFGGNVPRLLADLEFSAAPLAATPAPVGSRGPATPATPIAAHPEDLASQLAALPANRRRACLKERITGAAAHVLGLGAGHVITPTRPLRELGLDSLMAVELRNLLGRIASRQLPATLLFDYPAVEDLAAYLLDELLPAEPTPPPPAGNPAGDLEDALASLEQMSEDEIDRRLNSQLKGASR